MLPDDPANYRPKALSPGFRRDERGWASMASDGADPGEVIVELTRNGAYLKCSAVHVATGVEASAIGPASERTGLERIAIAKLKRALAAR